MVWSLLAGSGEAAGSGGAAPSCKSAQVTRPGLDLPFPGQTGACLAAAAEAKDEAQFSLLCEEL